MRNYSTVGEESCLILTLDPLYYETLQINIFE